MKPSLIEVAPFKLPDPRVLIKAKGLALRRAAGRARTRAASAFRQFGIGRRVFDNASRKVLGNMFKVGRLIDGGTALSIDVEARGLAGMQETGAQVKAYTISAESNRRRTWRMESGNAEGRPRLAFRGRGGRVLRPFTVNHPAFNMKKYTVVPKELDTALIEVDRDVSAIMNKEL